MIYWREILTAIGGTAALLMVLAFLARSLFQHWLDKDVEGHKQRLATDHQLALAKLSAELQQKATEHQIRFQALHQRVALAIAGTYSRLANIIAFAQNAASSSTHAEEDVNKRLDELRKALQEFRVYFATRRIYFQESIGQQIHDCYQTVWKIFLRFRLEIRREGAGRLPPDKDPYENAERGFNEEALPKLNEIRRRLQQLIGVPEE